MKLPITVIVLSISLLTSCANWKTVIESELEKTQLVVLPQEATQSTVTYIKEHFPALPTNCVDVYIFGKYNRQTGKAQGVMRCE